MPTTPVYALPYQSLADAPHGPDLGQDLAEAVEATLQGPLTLGDDLTVSGDLDVNGDIDWGGATTVASTQNTSGTTTSTSYTATLTGGTACGVAFVAPPSGMAMIHNTVQINGSGANSFCTIAVRTGAVVGSGTDVLAASDDEAVTVSNTTGVVRASTARLLTGLTPGASYNVQQNFKVNTGTGTFSRKHLVVTPAL